MSKDKKDKLTLGADVVDKKDKSAIVDKVVNTIAPIVQRANLKCNGELYENGDELKGVSDKILADLLKKGIIKYQ